MGNPEQNFRTTHDLPFLVASGSYLNMGLAKQFKVGTCRGLYAVTKRAYQIVAISNDAPGNGHFTDVLEWFENSARRDGKVLEVISIWNDRLRDHLISKRGFSLKSDGDVVKRLRVAR